MFPRIVVLLNQSEFKGTSGKLHIQMEWADDKQSQRLWPEHFRHGKMQTDTKISSDNKTYLSWRHFLPCPGVFPFTLLVFPYCSLNTSFASVVELKQGLKLIALFSQRVPSHIYYCRTLRYAGQEGGRTLSPKILDIFIPVLWKILSRWRVVGGWGRGGQTWGWVHYGVGGGVEVECMQSARAPGSAWICERWAAF